MLVLGSLALCLTNSAKGKQAASSNCFQQAVELRVIRPDREGWATSKTEPWWPEAMLRRVSRFVWEDSMRTWHCWQWLDWQFTCAESQKTTFMPSLVGFCDLFEHWLCRSPVLSGSAASAPLLRLGAAWVLLARCSGGCWLLLQRCLCCCCCLIATFASNFSVTTVERTRFPPVASFPFSPFFLLPFLLQLLQLELPCFC